MLKRTKRTGLKKKKSSKLEPEPSDRLRPKCPGSDRLRLSTTAPVKVLQPWREKMKIIKQNENLYCRPPPPHPRTEHHYGVASHLLFLVVGDHLLLDLQL